MPTNLEFIVMIVLIQGWSLIGPRIQSRRWLALKYTSGSDLRGFRLFCLVTKHNIVVYWSSKKKGFCWLALKYKVAAHWFSNNILSLIGYDSQCFWLFCLVIKDKVFADWYSNKRLLLIGSQIQSRRLFFLASRNPSRNSKTSLNYKFSDSISESTSSSRIG